MRQTISSCFSRACHSYRHDWSGVDPELPPILDSSEVGREMTLLDDRDGLTRRKVKFILLSLGAATHRLDMNYSCFSLDGFEQS
jgi:hypothetical protein